MLTNYALTKFQAFETGCHSFVGVHTSVTYLQNSCRLFVQLPAEKMGTPKNRITLLGNRYEDWPAIISTYILNIEKLFLGVPIFFCG